MIENQLKYKCYPQDCDSSQNECDPLPFQIICFINLFVFVQEISTCDHVYDHMRSKNIIKPPEPHHCEHSRNYSGQKMEVVNPSKAKGIIKQASGKKVCKRADL